MAADDDRAARVGVLSLLALVLLGALVTVLLHVVHASGADHSAERTVTPQPRRSFYHAPAPRVPDRPGQLVRSEKVAAPPGTRGWRVVYRSRSTRDSAIQVSGTVYVPTSPAPPGGRPILAWAHPTQGSGDGCASSRAPDPWRRIDQGAAMLARGYAVVATDFEGLGTPGPHPFGVPESMARSILDGVRAARQLPGTDLGNRLVAYGVTEGGPGAFATATVAPTYAPELAVLGVVSAGGPLNLPAAMDRMPQVEATGYVVEFAAGISAAAPHAPLRSLLTPTGSAHVGLVEHGCSKDLLAAYQHLSVAQTFRRDPRTTPPWSTWLQRDSITRLPPRVPGLVLQGRDDVIVLPRDTAAAVRGLCRRHADVDYRVLPGPLKSLSPAQAIFRSWVARRFAGAPTGSRGC